MGNKVSKKSKNNKKLYPVPPNAERPTQPSRPEVFQDQDQFFILRWDPPAYDGGCPIMGYVIQHLELGLPQLETQERDDTQEWYSSDPGQVTQTECILNNLVPGTTYQFRVIAENLIGYSLPSKVCDPIVFNPHGDLDDWFYPPEFTTILDQYYSVIEHEMLTLTVELRGQPYPILKWYDKNDQELTDPKKYKIKSTGYQRTLIISSVELSDAGTIKCIGSNNQGTATHSSIINVEAPPRITQSPENSDDYEEDLIFQAGELVRLKFVYSGSPKPTLNIFHNGEPVDPNRVLFELTETVITVKVENIEREDRGEWLVKLDNDLGQDCTSLLITVTDHPSECGRPEVLQLSDNSCIFHWQEPIDDGGCPVHNYVVEYFRTEWGVWLKALTTKVNSAKIKDLIPGSKYKFRVKAENLYGVSPPSPESVEILIPDIPSNRNPEIMTTVEESEEEDSKEEDEVEQDFEYDFEKLQKEYDEEDEEDLVDLKEYLLHNESVKPPPPEIQRILNDIEINDLNSSKISNDLEKDRIYQQRDHIDVIKTTEINPESRKKDRSPFPKDLESKSPAKNNSLPPEIRTEILSEDKEERYSPELNKYSPEFNKYSPELNTYSPELKKYSPELSTYSPELSKYSPELNKYFPELNKYSPELNTYSPELNTYSPELRKYSPDLNKYSPESNAYSPESNTYSPGLSKYSPMHEVSPEVERYSPEIPPRRRVENMMKRESSTTLLHERFTDYLTMKVTSRNKRVGSQFSLNSTSTESIFDTGKDVDNFGKAFEKSSEKLSEQLTQKLPEKLPDKVPEKVTEKVSPEAAKEQQEVVKGSMLKNLMIVLVMLLLGYYNTYFSLILLLLVVLNKYWRG